MSSLASDIHCGRVLAPGERTVWQGQPGWRGLAWRALGLRFVCAYFGSLTVIDTMRAARGDGDYIGALSPLLPGLLTAVVIVMLATMLARSTHYIVTERRVILRYGLVLPRSLSLPLSQIVSLAVSVGTDRRGDIALTLHRDNHMPYAKLWPHARGLHLRHPQPMLRGVADAGPVATQLARMLGIRDGMSRPAADPSSALLRRELCPEHLTEV